MSRPSFSVVIPAYNAPRTIEQTIDSVLAQTTRDLELIVVDDGSTDETPLLVERYLSDARVDLIRQANQGTARAKDTGIGRARAPYISFLDNDDLYMPTYLEEMGSALDARGDAGFAFTAGWALDDRTGRIGKASSTARLTPSEPVALDPSKFLAQLIRSNFVASAAMVRREALSDVGTFDPRVNGVDDYELWLRLAANGYPGALAPGRLIVQRDRPGSHSKNELFMAQALRQALELVVKEHPAPEDVRQAARARIDSLDGEIAIMEGRRPLIAAARAVRAPLAAASRTLIRSRARYRRPPREVAEAFPYLDE